MNFLIGLCKDDVGKNVFQNISKSFVIQKCDTFENQVVYCTNCGNNILFIVTLETMIDENSGQRRILQEKFDLDAIIMVAWHQGSERNCLILRSAGVQKSIAKTDANLSNFLAKSIFSIATLNNQSYYYEATHGPELFYDVPFLVLEIGGEEQDWNNALLGQSIAQILLRLELYPEGKENAQGYYYVAFGRSHCSKTLVKKCAEAGIVHYFAGRDMLQYAHQDIIEQIKSLNKQRNLSCKLLIHKRLDDVAKNSLIAIADNIKLDIEYFK